jgi:peroxiredoxin
MSLFMNDNENKIEQEQNQKDRTRYAKGLSLIQIMFLLAVLGIVLYGALNWLGKKEAAPTVTFKTIGGEEISTASLQGKVVLINFWATSCGPCKEEMPQLITTYNKYKDSGVELVAVAMHYDPAQQVQRYAQEHALPFKVAVDVDGKVATAFGEVTLTPTTFLIDKQGQIIKRFTGTPEFPELHKLLEDTLAA